MSANSYRMNFANLIENVASTFSKYVAENKEAIAEMDEASLTGKLMEIIDAPRAPPPVTGMAGLAPSLSAAAGFGKLQTKAPASKKKEVPPPLNLTLEDYTERAKEKQKICGHYLSTKKRVCGAACTDEDMNGEENNYKWRCVTCKGKNFVDVEKKLEKAPATKAGTPTRAVPGLNIPVTPPPVPTLGTKPPALHQFTASLPSLPAVIPNPAVPAVPSLPVPEEVPEAPIMPTLPKPPSPPKIAVPKVIEEPVDPDDDPAAPQPEQVAYQPVEGLANYYTTNAPGFKKVLFRLDGNSIHAVGRINGQIDATAPSRLVQLNGKETEFVTNVTKSTYKFEGTVPSVLPSIPTIPGLPGL